MTPVERRALSYHEIDNCWRTGGEINRRLGRALVCDLLEALRVEEPGPELAQLRGRLILLRAEIDHSLSRESVGVASSRGRHALD
jgi:hypothetical protein